MNTPLDHTRLLSQASQIINSSEVGQFIVKGDMDRARAAMLIVLDQLCKNPSYVPISVRCQDENGLDLRREMLSVLLENNLQAKMEARNRSIQWMKVIGSIGFLGGILVTGSVVLSRKHL